jgi:alginate O-acetyltransferase complex protein AlgI
MTRDTGRKKVWLTLGVAVNASALLYFKYANFFMDQLNTLLTATGQDPLLWRDVVLPIGISFFTFQKISYLVDLYRGTARPASSFTNYLLYVILFPQLIAGPIVRYHDIHEQLLARNLTSSQFFNGILRFCMGLGKKVLLANVLGEVADQLFGGALKGALPAPTAWLGVLCYAFQIYYDFSGYSDMAIGLGHMMGFTFLENFNRPYLASNFTEFWRRWHISLATWMREYLYIPLGGNRVSAARTYFNLWLVFLLSGFWHGASWNFVAWGAYHGFFLSLDKWRRDRGWSAGPAWLAIPLNFFLVTIGWVFFRADSLAHATQYLHMMFSRTLVDGSAWVSAWTLHLDARAQVIFCIALLLVFRPEKKFAALATTTGRFLCYLGGILLFILSAASLANSNFNPFIYFRF